MAGLALNVLGDERTKKYYGALAARVHEQFDWAKKARETGLDVSLEVESLPVADLADRTEKIAGPLGIAKRFREALVECNGKRMDTIFKVFKEIVAENTFNIPDTQKRVEQGIRTALVILTEGVVVAPLDGLPQALISRNPDGSRYVDVYFAGPIRAAGGSATVLPLILGDYAQKLLGLERYKPTEDEVERYVEEVSIYQTDVVSRQIKLTEEEIRIIVRGCPVCINGVPTEDVEVQNHRDLERIPTNKIRGGMGLVITEGVGLKALKILDWSKKLGLDWSFLEQIIKVEKKADKVTELKPVNKYLEGIAAGRPLLAYPQEYGGFRLRYGRCRNTGIAAKGINPATMALLDEFLAVGTHIKVERPGKAAQVFPCTTIEGPTVLLNDGSVRQVNIYEEAQALRPQVKRILFLGDLLVTVGDYRKSSHPLTPSPFVPEWWKLLVEKTLKEGKRTALSEERIRMLLKDPEHVPFSEACTLSKELEIPLHPAYTYYYTALSREQFLEVIQALNQGISRPAQNGMEWVVPFHERIKEHLENMGVPHKIQEESIVFSSPHADALAFTFVREDALKRVEGKEKVLECATALAGVPILDRAGTFVGARMGRPEAARERTMKGNPHILFPIGLHGGSTRSMNKAMNTQSGQTFGNIKVEASIFKCRECKQILPYYYCRACGQRTQKMYACKTCAGILETPECRKCGTTALPSENRAINLHELMEKTLKRMNERMPDPVKGVKGMISDDKVPEPLEKGILRAKHQVHVFRDGTCRFELLNAPLTHFTPNELGLSVERAHALGYVKDIQGKPLTQGDQLVELFPQDIVINEKGGDWLLSMSRFVDDLLEKFYALPRYYNAKIKDDLIGELVVGLAPHTSAGIVARVIGYSNARVGWGHPFFITCKRRNCLTGDTPVVIQNGHKTKAVAIRDLDDGTLNEEIPLENVFTHTIDEQGRLSTRKVKGLLKQKSPQELLKFKTKFGREITTTPNHKLLTFDGKKVVEKESSKFSPGENLLSLHSITSNSQVQEFNVLEFYLKKESRVKKLLRVHGAKKELRHWIKGHGGFAETARRMGVQNWKKMHTAVDFDSVPLDLFELLARDMKKGSRDFPHVRIGYNKQKSTIPSIIPFNRELGEIVGYYLADGYSRTTRGKREKFVYQVNWVSDERAVTKKLRDSALKLFGRTVTIEKRKLDYVTLSGRVYYEFFTEMLGTGARATDKRVPYLLLNSQKECLEGLLAGYIVGDGHINENSIKMTSVNKSLINDFGLACNLLGFFPHFINEKEREIKTGYVKEFYAKKGKTISIHSYGIRLYSEDLKGIGRHLFGKKAQVFDKIMETHPFRKKRIKCIGSFALDPIVEIRKVESKEEWVYDLMVEGEKNYIAGFGNLAVYDCDGDQDAIMLLLDLLLNFSHSYLASSRGGRMDAALVFTVALDPREIDDEVHEMETCNQYPLELYEKSLELSPPFLDVVPTVGQRLGTEAQYAGVAFTHETERFDIGPKQSMYIQLGSMEEKLRTQAKLQGKIRAVHEKDALERVLLSHLLPDIIGNTRAYSRQTFRCTKCNAKYRRIPLIGKCEKCSGNVILTIAEGSIKKYLQIAKNVVNEYGLSNYLKQRLELAGREIDTLFVNEAEKQKSLFEFA